MKTVIVAEHAPFVGTLAQEAFSQSQGADTIKIVAMPSSLEEVPALMQATKADVVILALDLEGDPIAMAKFLAHSYPRALVFAIAAPDTHPDQLRFARSQGFRDILVRPLSLAAIHHAIEKAEIEDRQPKAAPHTTYGTYTAPTAPSTIKSRVIAVYSPKGGVGKTAIATNLALAYAHNPTVKLSVCLVDLDLSWGDVATVLGLPASIPTILDWIPVVDRFEGPIPPEKVQELVVHTAFNVDVVAAPFSPGDHLRFQEKGQEDQRIRWILESLKRDYDVLIIDLEQQLRDSTIVTIEMAHRTLVVSTPDIQSLKAIYRTVSKLREAHVDVSRMRLVLNRMGRGSDLPFADAAAMAEQMALPVMAQLPEDPQMQLSINMGEPIVHRMQKGPFVTALRQLAHAEIPVFGRDKRRGTPVAVTPPVPPSKEDSKPFLRRLFGNR
ncbi:MAG: P-loop NTPase [Clostridiales bacterium]|nr:P-loop NTPase [Clostridiales bacterium]